MPAKRKAAATQATASKKARLGESSGSSSTTATGRQKRSSISEPPSNLKKRRTTDTKRAEARDTPTAEEVDVKRRGRPAAAETQGEAAAKPKSKGKSSTRPTTGRNGDLSSAPPPSKRRGQGKDKPTGSLTSPGDPSRADAIDAGQSVAGETDGGVEQETVTNIQYWLMKAEPESRMEKGHDVKFSIDDLAAKTEPEGWDGVRNAVARNNMRAMRQGDLAFFYHSNCAVPGIAGIMRIVGEHTVDESAFDPSHPYYDPKSSRDKPKWELVHVQFVKKFQDLITLKTLRSFGQPGGALEKMQMLKQSRLSVSAVSPQEWSFILEVAGESPDLVHNA